MRKRLAIVLCVAAMACSLFGAPVGISEFGGVKAGALGLGWAYYRAGWKGTPLNEKTFYNKKHTKGKNSETLTGVWKIEDTEVQVESILTQEGDKYRLRMSLSAKEGLPASETIAISVSLPVAGASLSIDDKPLKLPYEHNQQSLKTGTAENVEVGTYGGVLRIEGVGRYLVQDNYKWGNTYSVRLLVGNSTKEKPLTTISKEVTLTYAKDKFQKIDITKLCNWGYSDAVAGDGKGGWTDQGPDNDMSSFPMADLTAFGVPFKVVDEKKNNGLGNLTLAAEDRDLPSLPRDITVSLVKSKGYRYLFLLHAAGWTPKGGEDIGTLTVNYMDGTSDTQNVQQGRDCGNWWLGGLSLPNGGIGWTGANSSSKIGLYVSCFPLKSDAKSVKFEVKRGFWFLSGMTLGSRSVSFAQSTVPTIFHENKDWGVYEFTRETIPGSPLDFSGHNETPAGKHGFLKADSNGHFYFEKIPNKRVRLFGTNFCSSANTITHEGADEVVKKLAQCGYNTLRLHHMERPILDTKNFKDSLHFDKEKIDHWFYLVYACKKAGLYVTIDLYCSRLLQKGDGIAETDNFSRHEMKALAPISPTAMENWKAYTRLILTTVNPYTKLPLAQDPVLAFLDLMNEDHPITQMTRYPEITKVYKQKYQEYLRENNIDENKNPGAFHDWLNQKQIACIREMTRFLREEIKTPALITDINWQSNLHFASARKEIDIVDNHQYASHPRFPVKPWSLPTEYQQISAVGNHASLPRAMMPARVFGKPFTVTEWNYCNPNMYRVEAAALMGAYASLQDWDGLYRFAWSHSDSTILKNGHPSGFNQANDFLQQLAERVIWAMFARGDVKPASEAVAATFDSKSLKTLPNRTRYPANFSMLGLYARIGTLVDDLQFQNVPKVEILAENWEEKLPSSGMKAVVENVKEGTSIRSSTGEILITPKEKCLAVKTSRSCALTCVKDAASEVITVKGVKSPQAFYLVSLDEQPLETSKKILFIHLVNLTNTDQKFDTDECTLLRSWGRLPGLYRKAKVDVSLAVPAAKVTALKLDGAENGEVPATFANGKLQFTADNTARKEGLFVYLLSR
ncbi:MAG: hypothetical protein IJJ26_07445 [Victivallales bacterium]|nr:hypothetical protein [Victivallales bacterium]